MNAFLLNVIFAGVWSALVGEVDVPHLAFGFLVGYGVLWLMRPLIDDSYHRKLPMLIGFVLFFLRELTVSTLRVAWEVVTPDDKRRPGIVEVPLDAKTDNEITLLANLVLACVVGIVRGQRGGRQVHPGGGQRDIPGRFVDQFRMGNQ